MNKNNKSKQEKESLIEKKEEKLVNSNQPLAVNNSTNDKKPSESQPKTPSRFE
jgi:hypothetical protein